MNITITRSIFFITAVVAIGILSLSAYGSNDHEKDRHMSGRHENGHSQKADPGENPLIEEMIKLDAVFREVVSGVALRDGHRVHEALEQMHGTMERTHEGVRHGTVALKKNPDRTREFVEQDQQFHARLEALAQAASKSDETAMRSLTKDLLDRCVRCHRDFRAS